MYFYLSGLLGILYNIRPIRLKNIPYIDVISESFNNPVRFLIGWFVVVKSEFPSVLILLATWSIGAVLMTAKRYDELKFCGKKLVLIVIPLHIFFRKLVNHDVFLHCFINNLYYERDI